VHPFVDLLIDAVFHGSGQHLFAQHHVRMRQRVTVVALPALPDSPNDPFMSLYVQKTAQHTEVIAVDDLRHLSDFGVAIFFRPERELPGEPRASSILK
jgi:hypothetical protein